MDTNNNFEALIEELERAVTTFSSAKSHDLSQYLKELKLCQEAKESASAALSRIEAIRLEEQARTIIRSFPDKDPPTDQVLSAFRLLLLAQVLRDGFSPKVNSAIAALFPKTTPAQDAWQNVSTTLRVIPEVEGVPHDPEEDAHNS